MIFQRDDWILRVDLDATRRYSHSIQKEHCSCGYCRNFYGAVHSHYPALCLFLNALGTDVEAPDELMPFEPTLLEVTYCVCGEIIKEGIAPLSAEGLYIQPMPASRLDFQSECPDPHFALVVSGVTLPWILPEDMNEVVSPANEPEYLARMWNRWLQQAQTNDVCS